MNVIEMGGPVKRPREACVGCRSIKTRCIPTSPSATSKDPCTRCARYGLICEYTRNRRGRKPRDSSSKSSSILHSTSRGHEERWSSAPVDSDRSFTQDSFTNGHLEGQFVIPTASHLPLLDTSIASASRTNTAPPTAISQTDDFSFMMNIDMPHAESSRAGSSLDHREPGARQVFVDSPDGLGLQSTRSGVRPLASCGKELLLKGQKQPSTPPRSRTVNISSLLEPHLGVDDSRPPSRGESMGFSDSGPLKSGSIHHNASPPVFRALHPHSPAPAAPALTRSTYLNPVELGFLSDLEARRLFEQFMFRIQPLMVLFDPAYHTHARVSKSPVLYTAVLSVTCRFLRPELAPILREHAMSLINRIVDSGAIDITLVQALMVLAYCKHVEDRSAYLKIGLAVRAACQLRIDTRRKGPLPDGPGSEDAVREILDRERTWWNLLQADWAYSQAFDLPPFVPYSASGKAELVAWAGEHRGLDINVDRFMSFTAGLGVLGARVPDAATMGSMIDQPSESEWHLMAKERAFSNHLMTHILEGSLSGVHLDAAKTLTSMILIPVKAGQVEVSKGSLAKSGLIMATEELYGHLQHMADEGWLTYWSDLCISGLTLPAYMLYRTRKLYDSTEIAKIQGILRLYLTMLEKLDQNAPPDHGHAVHHILRFFRRVIGVFQRIATEMNNVDPSMGTNTGTQMAPPDMNPTLETDSRADLEDLLNGDWLNLFGWNPASGGSAVIFDPLPWVPTYVERGNGQPVSL